ncbi:MAG: MFS transporter, partial [Nakamurella sp.]
MLATLRANRWLTLVTLSLGVALIVIDGTIVNVALPVIIRDLHLNFTDAQWVTTIYALVFAGLLITTGRLADRFGRRRLFALGVVVFVVSSVFAGFAASSGDLLAARVFQGVGGALILPSTLSTVNATFVGRDRAIAFGVWGSVISGMAAVGPLLGGWLTTDHSWRWIFYVNVPVGAVLLVGIVLFVPETRGSDFAPGADIVGFLLSTVGLAALVFGLVEGGTYGWWRPTAALHLAGLTWSASAAVSIAAASIALGLALLAIFVVWERRRASA